METGYVYILENESYNDIIKIGATSYDGYKRAKELSNSSGVPTPFRVAYQERVNDYIGFEKELHLIFSKSRINKRREFFNISADNAVAKIKELKKSSRFLYNFHISLDLLDELKKIYGNGINDNSLFCKLHQVPDMVYVEFGMCNQHNNSGWSTSAQSCCLDFLMNTYDDYSESVYFNPNDSIDKNRDKFINLDATSLSMCIGEIFEDGWLVSQGVLLDT